MRNVYAALRLLERKVPPKRCFTLIYELISLKTGGF